MAEVGARVLEAPPAAWDALLAADPNATPAHRPELVEALCATLPGTTARFVAVDDSAGLAGGAVLLLERRLGFHWIHAMPFVLPGSPLAREGAHRRVDAAVAAAIAGLRRELAVVGGEWVLYRPRGPAFEPTACDPLSGETRVLECALIELEGGLEPIWRRIQRDTRHELRRARRGGLRFVEEPQALDEVYALHLAQGRGRAGHRPLPLELSRRLLAPPVRPGPGSPPARLFAVRDRRGLLGATLFLDHPTELMAWWSGARPRARSAGAMPFLYWSAVEWAAAAGRRRLNLGGSPGLPGVAAFKHSLGARGYAYPVRWLDAATGSWLGRAVAAWQGRVRRRRHRGALG